MHPYQHTNLLIITHCGCHRHDIREGRVYRLTLIEQQNERCYETCVMTISIPVLSKSIPNMNEILVPYRLMMGSSSRIGTTTLKFIFNVVLTMGQHIYTYYITHTVGQLEV